MNSLKEELLDIQAMDTNEYCFDCFSQPANFCSVSEGIFLCFNCAGEHRGYYKPKTVKSISLDEWTEEEVKLMLYGGNRNLRKFLNESQIPKNISKEDVFMSNAMNYYRRKLLKEVREELFEEEPPNPKERFKRYKETKEELISDDEDEEIIDNRNKIFKDNEYNKFSQQYSRKSKFLTLIEQEPNKSDLSKYLREPKNEKKNLNEKGALNESNKANKINSSSYPTLHGIASSMWNYGSKIIGFGYNYLSYLLKPSQNAKIVPEELEGNNYNESLINK